MFKTGDRVTVLEGWGGKCGQLFRRMAADTQGTIVGDGRIGGNVLIVLDDCQYKRQWEIPKRGLADWKYEE